MRNEANTLWKVYVNELNNGLSFKNRALQGIAHFMCAALQATQIYDHLKIIFKDLAQLLPYGCSIKHNGHKTSPVVV